MNMSYNELSKYLAVAKNCFKQMMLSEMLEDKLRLRLIRLLEHIRVLSVIFKNSLILKQTFCVADNNITSLYTSNFLT